MRAEAAGYIFAGSREPALREIAIAIEPGEVVLVTGPTGSGKSTILRLLAGILFRQGAGTAQGRVTIDGGDVRDLDPAERVRAIGFVGQEPGDQLLAGTLGDEVAFALESSHAPLGDADARVEALLAEVGLPFSPSRSTSHLSGGELQRLEIAAALSADATTLLLDEPLAQLDATGATELLALLGRLASHGRRIVVAEHRLEAALSIATRLVVLDGGRICLDIPASAVRPGSDVVARLRSLGLQIPGAIDLEDHRLRIEPPPAAPRATSPSAGGGGEPVLEGAERPPLVLRTRNLRCVRAGVEVLHGVDLEVRAGERVAVVGPNGAGKSTLLEAIAGWAAGRLPSVEAFGRVVLVPQDPDLALVAPTVAEELALAPSELGLDVDVEGLAKALDLESVLGDPPQALSRGQRQRVAVAAALAARPAGLLLDEPTTGQDRAQVERLLRAVPELVEGALVFATHDLDLAARLATRVIVLDGGTISFDGAPGATIAWLAARGTPLPGVLAACLAHGLPPMSAAQLAYRLVESP